MLPNAASGPAIAIPALMLAGFYSGKLPSPFTVCLLVKLFRHKWNPLSSSSTVPVSGPFDGWGPMAVAFCSVSSLWAPIPRSPITLLLRRISSGRTGHQIARADHTMIRCEIGFTSAVRLQGVPGGSAHIFSPVDEFSGHAVT